ncbi:hypothetical protein [Nakamurella multipartita]|uniref:Uncharacterized protein n=1 Tax=Nakamurella multipartita (strain ATCC 700099 / DSM 44233 / CIP 104796 / JCM 9543 / NBRC 105858 / Y-104) TaxID=479431 RepID=C8X722_NAKMY|nr:hypothetical protein [Nakamurella multipartita]ACV76891.1 hypothetical protein Namu_0472 [Nakamurella multipartita DSM 44233]
MERTSAATRTFQFRQIRSADVPWSQPEARLLGNDCGRVFGGNGDAGHNQNLEFAIDNGARTLHDLRNEGKPVLLH